MNSPPDVLIQPCELGRGLFAARAFVPQERILKFIGPVITFAEAIAKGEAEANVLQFDHDRYLDLEAPGVFLNHSCAPNTGISDGYWLIALHTIAVGEELRFDYSTTMHENRWMMACRCGASNCRGTVADFRLLPHDRREHYLRLGIVQPFIAQALGAAR